MSERYEFMNIQRAGELQAKGYEQLPMRLFDEATHSLAVDHLTKTFYIVNEQGKSHINNIIKNQNQ